MLHHVQVYEISSILTANVDYYVTSLLINGAQLQLSLDLAILILIQVNFDTDAHILLLFAATSALQIDKISSSKKEILIFLILKTMSRHRNTSEQINIKVLHILK